MQRIDRLKSDLILAVPNQLDDHWTVGAPARNPRPQVFRSVCQVRLALISSYLL
jgi:hypothetical protein